jgi:hypothetical protein
LHTCRFENHVSVDVSNYVPAPEFVNDTTSGHKLQYFTIYSARPGDGGQSHYIDFSVDILDTRTNSRVGTVTFHQNACFLEVSVWPPHTCDEAASQRRCELHAVTIVKLDIG